jgi:hypothetical protein
MGCDRPTQLTGAPGWVVLRLHHSKRRETHSENEFTMAYYTSGFSFVAKNCPQFDFVKKIDVPEVPGFFQISPHKNRDKLASLDLPDTFRMASSHKVLPNIFNAMYLCAVDLNIKQLVEKLEPNVHYFREVTLLKKDGTAFEGPYFLFYIRNMIDSLNPDFSDMVMDRGLDDPTRIIWSSRGDRRTMNPGIRTTQHLWFEWKLRSNIYVSDAFYAEYTKQKYRGVNPFHYVTEL